MGRHPARPERWLWSRQDGIYDIRCLACTTPGYGWPILRDGPERHPGELDQPAPAESITRHNGHLSRPGNPWTQLSVNRCCLGRRRPAMMHRRVTSGGAFWWDHTLSPCRREACWSTIGGLCRGTTAPAGWASDPATWRPTRRPGSQRPEGEWVGAGGRTRRLPLQLSADRPGNLSRNLEISRTVPDWAPEPGGHRSSPGGFGTRERLLG